VLGLSLGTLGPLVEDALADDQSLREKLTVPDGERRIFAEGRTTLAQLNGLRQELDGLLAEIGAGLRRQAREISQARVQHMVATL